MIEWAALVRTLTSIIPFVNERRLQRRGPAVLVEERQRNYMNAWDLVTPLRVRREDGPLQLSTDELRRWFVRNRAAVSARDSFVLLELTGRSKAPTRIENIEAVIVSREQPYTGSSIHYPPAGGGDVDHIYLDLDHPDRGPLRDRWPDDQPPSEPFFSQRFLSVAQNESTRVLIRACTSSSAIEWAVRVTYRVGDRPPETWTSQEHWRVSAVGDGAKALAWRWWEEPMQLVALNDLYTDD